MLWVLLIFVQVQHLIKPRVTAIALWHARGRLPFFYNETHSYCLGTRQYINTEIAKRV